MEYLLYVLTRIVDVLLIAIEVCFFIRAVLSIIAPMSEGKFATFIFTITETIIAPVRAVLYRLFPALEESPVDISFIVAYILLVIIQSILL